MPRGLRGTDERPTDRTSGSEHIKPHCPGKQRNSRQRTVCWVYAGKERALSLDRETVDEGSVYSQSFTKQHLTINTSSTNTLTTKPHHNLKQKHSIMPLTFIISALVLFYSSTIVYVAITEKDGVDIISYIPNRSDYYCSKEGFP